MYERLEGERRCVELEAHAPRLSLRRFAELRAYHVGCNAEGTDMAGARLLETTAAGWSETGSMCASSHRAIREWPAGSLL